MKTETEIMDYKNFMEHMVGEADLLSKDTEDLYLKIIKILDWVLK